MSTCRRMKARRGIKQAYRLEKRCRLLNILSRIITSVKFPYLECIEPHTSSYRPSFLQKAQLTIELRTEERRGSPSKHQSQRLLSRSRSPSIPTRLHMVISFSKVQDARNPPSVGVLYVTTRHITLRMPFLRLPNYSYRRLPDANLPTRPRTSGTRPTMISSTVSHSTHLRAQGCTRFHHPDSSRLPTSLAQRRTSSTLGSVKTLEVFLRLLSFQSSPSLL